MIILALGSVLIALVLGAVVFGVQFNKVPQSSNNTTPITNSRITVAASTSTLTEFVTAIGGDAIEFIAVSQDNIGEHDFEPTVQDIATLQTVDLFVMHGAGYDAWAQRIAPQLQQKGVEVLAVTDNIQLRPAEGAGDPHVWLDPVLVQQIISSIRDELITIDPTNESTYTSASQKYLETLAQLNQEYTEGLKDCESRSVIVAHDAFQYLGDRYNIEVLPIAGISPESEPSARRIAELIDIARERNVTTIFFETLTTPALSNTIAQEIGATTDVLNPLEGLTTEERQKGKTYLTGMRENLQRLRAALRCK